MAQKNIHERIADDFATKLLLPKKAILELYEEYGNIPTIANYF
jgi:Zn-dependent peptidase ImmA (M78 family)